MITFRVKTKAQIKKKVVTFIMDGLVHPQIQNILGA